MTSQLNFTPFTVQQLFPSDPHSANDDKKVKATEITNIKIKNVYDQCQEAIVNATLEHNDNAVCEYAAIAHGYNLNAAQEYASSHHTRLSRKVKRREIDQVLFSMRQKGMPTSELQRIAQIYGFNFVERRSSGGVIVTINRI